MLRHNQKQWFIFTLWIAICLLHSGFLKTTEALNEEGNKHYEGKRYQSALKAYQGAQIREPDKSEIRYNLAATQYQLDDFQASKTQLDQVLTNTKDNDLKAQAWYNYGNTQYRLGQFEKAIEAYRNTLDLNADDKDAKYNLELLQQKKALFEKEQDKRDQERKEKPQPQPQRPNQEEQGGKGRQPQKQEPEAGKEDQQDQDQESQDQKPKGEPGETQEEQEQPDEEEDTQGAQGDQRDERETPPAPARFEPQQQKQPEEGENQQAPKQLYQGQMSKEHALRLLDALRDSEQQLQMLRQPTEPQKERPPLKDW